MGVGMMWEVPTIAKPTPRQDRAQDLALAEGAARYLERQGLERKAVVQCLIDEFELDRETAEALAELAA